ncbi:MAG: hypothetical protein J6D33_07895 [Turicibacter sp.]|nr:hypothetical protein [Turicibacter sp.]
MFKMNRAYIHSIYRYLKQEAKGLFGSEIKCNFTKFLINRDAPTIKPLKIANDIEKLLLK